MQLVVAGHEVEDPMASWGAYANWRRTATSLRRYDLADRGDPHSLTAEEASRSRIIVSHVTNEQAAWFASQARSAPWERVPAEAHLRDADPRELDGLYDRAASLYEHFLTAAPSGIKGTKIHKVLHIKRPHLFPVMDTRLWRLYRAAATAAASGLRDVRPGELRLYWAAFRADLVEPNNAAALAAGRSEMTEQGGLVAQMATLSDVRLLDILAWRIG